MGSTLGRKEGSKDDVGSVEGKLEGASVGTKDDVGRMDGNSEGNEEEEGSVVGNLEGVMVGTKDNVGATDGFSEGNVEEEGSVEGKLEGVMVGTKDDVGATDGAPDGSTKEEGFVDGKVEGVTVGNVVKGPIGGFFLPRVIFPPNTFIFDLLLLRELASVLDFADILALLDDLSMRASLPRWVDVSMANAVFRPDECNNNKVPTTSIRVMTFG